MRDVGTRPMRGSMQNTAAPSAIQAGEIPWAKSVSQSPRAAVRTMISRVWAADVFAASMSVFPATILSGNRKRQISGMAMMETMPIGGKLAIRYSP